MADDVYLCFECGTKNRVAANEHRFRAKCAKCKAYLFPEEASKSSPATHGTWARKTDPTPSRHSPQREGNGKTKLFLGLVAAGIVATILVSNNESGHRSPSRTTASHNSQTTPAAPLPPAVFQPAGIMFNRTGFSGNHPFEIVTSPGKDYFIKLVDNTTGDDRIGIFVTGGQRIEVKVPTGQYRMRYASGDTWRGMKNFFGPEKLTSYHASSKVFNFNVSGDYYTGYIVELIGQIDGNMDTHSIPASSF